MKRMITFALVLACLLSLAAPASAASTDSREITYYDDGSYLIVTVSTAPQSRASGTTPGSASAEYYNADDVLRWVVTLTGSFTYNGSSATCTSANIDATIYESGWSCSSKSAYASGSSAIGSATMVRKVLGVQVDSVPVSLKITCDKNGALS